MKCSTPLIEQVGPAVHAVRGLDKEPGPFIEGRLEGVHDERI